MVILDKLIVICEGGIHTIEYLHKNGVYPSSLLTETSKFQEISPYLGKEDDILLIIKGLTDFTMASIYGLLKRFDAYKDKYKRVTILTNVPLGSVNYEYYLYSGDLFYGTVKKVVNKKQYDLDDNGNIIENTSKVPFKRNKIHIATRNPIALQFKKYSDRKVKLMIYGQTGITTESKSSMLEYEDKVRAIDLFKNSKSTESKENEIVLTK